VGRLYDLAVEMAVRHERLAIVVNRLRGRDLPEAVSALRRRTGADCVVALPEDRTIAELGERGEALARLPEDNPVVEELDRLLSEVGLGATTARAG
jgi:CO dehydrogenase nickel-insertion accessory protein CooC1